ncbi:MAG: site-2 protease family protein [Granulosicoccus sp.]
MTTLGLVVAILVFLFASQLIRAVGRIMHLRLRVPVSRAVTPADIPESIRQSLTEAVDPLRDAGFLFSHYEKRQDLEAVIEQPKWVAVYWHVDESSYAEVATALKPDRITPVNVAFVTLYDSCRLMTLGTDEGIIHHEAGGNLIFKSTSPGYAGQWQTHLNAVADFEQNETTESKRLRLDLVHYVRRLNTDIKAYYNALCDNGHLIYHGDKFRISWHAISKLLFGSKTPSTPALKNTAADSKRNLPTDASIIPLEVDAFQRRRQFESGNKMSVPFKLTVLLASAIFSSVFLGFVFSFKYALFLIPVLLFHELGHFLAMSLFGYTNKYILFMPLGAVAIGERDDAPTWQRMIVCLSGPVPGITLAFALLMFLPEIDDIARGLIATLLIINCLNLLPVMPLDGGQLVNLAITTRFPKVQLLLHIASFLFALIVALLLQDPFLFVITAWLGFGIKESYLNIGLFNTYRQFRKSGDNQDSLVYKLFDYMQAHKSGFDTKYNRVRYFQSLVSQRRSAMYKPIGLMIVYAFFLIGPGYLLLNNTAGSLTRIAGFADFSPDDYADIAYSDSFDSDTWLDSKFANADNTEEKVYALIEAGWLATFDDNLEQGLEYFQQAEAEASKQSHHKQLHAETLTALVEYYVETDNPQQISSIVEMFKTRSAAGTEYLPELANSYVHWTALAAMDSSTRQSLFEKALIIQRQLGDLAAESMTLEEFALHYDQIGDQSRARTLRVDSTNKDYGDELWLKASAFQNLAYHDIRQKHFKLAYANMLRSLELYGAEGSDSYMDEELGWILILGGNLSQAERRFTERDAEYADLQQEINDDVGFIYSVLLTIIDADTDFFSSVDVAPWLVIAYLNNDHVEATKRLIELNQHWEQLGISDESPRDIYTYQLQDASDADSFEAQKARLVIDAITYASSQSASASDTAR